jgi:hypothetical protein
MMADCPRCGRPESEHALILYAGGLGRKFTADRSEAARKARKLTPAISDASEPSGPSAARSGTGTTARRLNARQAAAVKAWRKVGERRATT